MSDRRRASQNPSNNFTPGPSVFASPRMRSRVDRIPGGAIKLHPGVKAALALSAMWMSGCVSESYHARDVGRYQAILDHAAPTSRPTAFDPTQPLELTRALQVANADNESIAISGENYVQALAEKERAAGAFLPTLSLSPSYSFTHNRGSNVTSVSGTTIGGTGTPTDPVTAPQTIIINTGPHTTENKSVRANASLQTSLADVSTLEASSLSVEQREQLLLDERETILVNVVDAYYTVLRDERQTAVYEANIQYRSEAVRDQEARLKLKSVRPLDLAQSQSDLAGVRAQLTQSKTDALNARSALARLMGVNAVSGPLTDAFVPPETVGDLDTWQTDAATNRQDLHAADRGLEVARANVDAAIRQYFPSVSINFSYYLYNKPSTSTLWTGGISANVPIFSGLQIEADIRRAWSAYRAAGLTQQQTRRLVLDDVNQNYQNVANSRSRLVDYQIQVEAAQRAVDLANRAYQLGSETNLDRLLQQDNLLTAQLNLIFEQFGEKRYYLGLLRSAGRLGSVLPPPPQDLPLTLPATLPTTQP